MLQDELNLLELKLTFRIGVS